MKRIITLVFAIILFAISSVQSQTKVNDFEANSFKINNQFDFSVGATKGETIESLSYKHVWGLGKNKRWRVGGGLRFSSYQGSNVNYESAPPKYAGKKDLTDTVFVPKARQNNVALLLKIGRAHV